MKKRWRAWLLVLLMCAAAAAGKAAFDSFERPVHEVPEEVYGQYSSGRSSAQYFLREYNGRLAVYRDEKYRNPVLITTIEVSSLRGADRAMLERGLPVRDRETLLSMLEDLDS